MKIITKRAVMFIEVTTENNTERLLQNSKIEVRVVPTYRPRFNFNVKRLLGRRQDRVQILHGA